jgi:rubrerythrin
MARNAEIQAQNFYTSVADSTPNEAVRKLGLEFAYEEAEHVDLVNKLIAKYPKPEKGWDFDPDPPSNPD